MSDNFPEWTVFNDRVSNTKQLIRGVIATLDRVKLISHISIYTGNVKGQPSNDRFNPDDLYITYVISIYDFQRNTTEPTYHFEQANAHLTFEQRVEFTKFVVDTLSSQIIDIDRAITKRIAA